MHQAEEFRIGHTVKKTNGMYQCLLGKNSVLYIRYHFGNYRWVRILKMTSFGAFVVCDVPFSVCVVGCL